MKTRKRIAAVTVTALLTIGMTLNFSGCSKENSIGPEVQKNNANIVLSNIGKIKILSAKTDISLAKGVNDSVFYMEKFIKRKEGGELIVGNLYYGRSRIAFDENDLPRNMTIQFEWTASNTFTGMLNSLEFGPHGTVFNKPVKVVLSYKRADLTGVDENKLKIFYFNEDSRIWN